MEQYFAGGHCWVPCVGGASFIYLVRYPATSVIAIMPGITYRNSSRTTLARPGPAHRRRTLAGHASHARPRPAARLRRATWQHQTQSGRAARAALVLLLPVQCSASAVGQVSYPTATVYNSRAMRECQRPAASHQPPATRHPPGLGALEPWSASSSLTWSSPVQSAYSVPSTETNAAAERAGPHGCMAHAAGQP